MPALPEQKRMLIGSEVINEIWLPSYWLLKSENGTAAEAQAAWKLWDMTSCRVDQRSDFFEIWLLSCNSTVECLTKLSRKTELRYGAPAELRLLAELRLPLLSRALSLSLPPYYLIWKIQPRTWWVNLTLQSLPLTSDIKSSLNWKVWLLYY